MFVWMADGCRRGSLFTTDCGLWLGVRALDLPISPLELDSVKLGVPSVHVGVEPSLDAGGVHANAPREPY